MPPHLEGVEEEGEEHLDVAQDARGLLVGGEDENDLVDAEEGDEGQGGFGQPGAEQGDSKTPRESQGGRLRMYKGEERRGEG